MLWKSIPPLSKCSNAKNFTLYCYIFLVLIIKKYIFCMKMYFFLLSKKKIYLLFSSEFLKYLRKKFVTTSKMLLLNSYMIFFLWFKYKYLFRFWKEKVNIFLLAVHFGVREWGGGGGGVAGRRYLCCCCISF